MPPRALQVAPEVVDVLRRCTVDESSVTLPGQLDPKLYRQVNAVLARLGGMWNRKAGSHLFQKDPRVALHELFTAESPSVAPTTDSLLSFWRTPPDLARRVVTYAAIPGRHGARVLEPSAGDGALVSAIVAARPGAYVVAVEPDVGRAAELARLGVDGIIHPTTLEDYALGHAQRGDVPFDAVVMNPPFTLPGHPHAWAEHITIALGLLEPTGRLVAVVPSTWATSDRGPIRDLKGDLSALRAVAAYEPLPEGSFKSAGTGVNTGLLTIALRGGLR